MKMESLDDFLKGNKKIFILGYCQRGALVEKYALSQGCDVRGFIEIVGENRAKSNVYSIDQIEQDSSIVVAVRYIHFNDVIPAVVQRGIQDVYFLSANDIDKIRNYNNLFVREGEYSLDKLYPSRKKAYESAMIILTYLSEHCSINSAIDFGCGSGAYLAAVKHINPSATIKGLDICEIDRSEFVPNQMVSIVNFEKYSHKKDERYDIAISIECAEHIDEKYADLFVENLCKASDIILFSAAIPYQSGDGHVNCKWPSYWNNKFEKNGYLAADFLRKLIWNDSRVMLYCKQNIVCYVAENSPQFQLFKELISQPLDVVHPIKYENDMQKIYEGTY